MSYNGYINYETWCCSFWIDNDEYLQEHFSEQAEKLSVSELRDKLKNEINELAPELPGVYGDLLQAALDSINFYEIAENLKESL